MDTSVEDTIRKAKRARLKAPPRGHKRSVPQHTRGYAIQPSQEVPDSQAGAPAVAGAEDEDVQDRSPTEGFGEGVAASHSTKPTVRPAKKPRNPRSGKQLHWQEGAVGPVEDRVDPDEPALEDSDINTLNDGAGPSRPRERRRSDTELEKLQRDVQDFVPEFESTPKPQAPAKTRKRKVEVENLAAIAETGETGEGREKAATKAQRLKRGKAGNLKSRSNTQTGQKSNSVPSDLNYDSQATEKKPVRQHIGDLSSVSSDGEDPPVESIPTPPESPDVPVSDAVESDNEGNENVQQQDDDEQRDMSWIAPDDSVATGRDTASPAKTQDKAKSPKKRKRTHKRTITDRTGTQDREPPVPKDSNHDNVEDSTGADQKQEQDIIANAEQHKNQRQILGDDEGSGKRQRGQVKGTWSKEERARADEIFDDIVRVTAIPAYELKVNIIDWKNPTPALQQLKNEFYEAFPQRDFKSIAKFCQRRYNSFQRGKWTEEQDKLLREAFELWPDQWTVISDHVDRFWEDCRGRWRDVLSRPVAKAEAGPWSREEELRLANVVHECRDTVMKETEDDEIRDDPEKADAMVNWKVVSEMIGDTRGAKRCREKWNRIKHHEHDSNSTFAASQLITAKKPSARTLAADAKFEECENGDVYDMLSEICDGVPEKGKVFDHETTFWSVVAVRNPNSRFTSALRRKALTTALDQYSCKAVRVAKTLADKADAAKSRMEMLETKGEIQLTRSYGGKSKAAKVKKANAKGSDTRPASKQAARTRLPVDEVAKGAGDGASVPRETPQPGIESAAKYARKAATWKGNNHKYKSADLVVESDEDEQEGADDDVQVAQTPAEGAGYDDAEEANSDDDAGEDAGDDDRKARQQTDELSLDNRDPGLSPSTFLQRCKGPQQKGGKGKEGAKNKEKVKGRAG